MNDTMVTRALLKVFHTLIGTDAPLVISYGNNSDALWDLDGLWLNEQQVDTLKHGLVLIWDGAAPAAVAGRNTGEYLNPLTWALCAVKRYPFLRIAVVDCDTTRNANGKFYRVVQALDPAKRPFGLLSDSCRYVADLLVFLKSKQSTESPCAVGPESFENQKSRQNKNTTIIDLLANQVKAMLAERGAESDHHALSNIIGPLILMGNSEWEKLPPSQRALYALFRDIGLLGPIKPATTKQLETHDESLEKGEGLGILLVDDQAECGWAQWVKECLPGGDHQSMTSPLTLLESIKFFCSGKKDARFRFEVPGFPGLTNVVLLLDLRLFTGKSQQALAFYKEQLLPLIREFFLDKKDLAWPSFSSTDGAFSKAVQVLESGECDIDSPEHREFLTWFPRVLALADMSVPIVVFSSTGRRDLMESMKSYGNIITLFEKPRLNDFLTSESVATDVRDQTVSALRKAIGKAREWLRFRDASQRAVKAADMIKERHSDMSAFHHYEIYFDESGSSRADGFRIAAMIVGYKDSGHADQVAKRMQDHGVSWFGEKGRYCYEKEAARNAADVQRLGELFAPELFDVWTLPLVLWSDPGEQQTSSDCFNADTLIQSMVGELLEICFMTLLPKESYCTYVVIGARRQIMIPNTRFTVTVTPPFPGQVRCVTKQELELLSVKLPCDTADAVKTYMERHGISDEYIRYDIQPLGSGDRINGRAMLLSIATPQDYGGILARCFQTRPWVEPWKQLSSNIKLRLSQLNHPETSSIENGDRPIHIIVDIIPGAATWDARGASLNVVSTFFKSGGGAVLLAEGAELSRLLAISRAVDGGDYGLALANVVSLSNELFSSAGILYQDVLASLARNVDSMHGSHLISASSHLGLLPEGKDGGLPFARIDLRHQHWTRYSKPDATIISKLEKYCDNKILITFGIPPCAMEKNVALWILAQLVESEYSEICPSVEWMQDAAKEELFAVVEYNGIPLRPPFRWRKMHLAETFKPDQSAGQLILKLSMGPLPVGRLQVDMGNKVSWLDATHVSLTDNAWTHAQIMAVNDSLHRRSVPLPGGKLGVIKGLLRGTPRWFKDKYGCYVLFLESKYCEGFEVRKTFYRHCAPSDYDKSGVLCHVQGSWPSASHYIDVQNSVPCREARSSTGRMNQQKVVTKVTAHKSPIKTTGESSQSNVINKSEQDGGKDVKLSQALITSNAVLLGPVPLGVGPKTIHYDQMMRILRETFPDWKSSDAWESRDDKWWVPLTRKAAGVGSLPHSVILLGQKFSIIECEPPK